MRNRRDKNLTKGGAVSVAADDLLLSARNPIRPLCGVSSTNSGTRKPRTLVDSLGVLQLGLVAPTEELLAKATPGDNSV